MHQAKQMTRMKKFIIASCIVLVSAVGYGFYLYYKPHQGIANKEAAFTLESKKLFDEYSTDESASNNKYLGKIVSVFGRVVDKGVDANGTFSLIMEGGDFAGVGCQFDKSVLNEMQTIKKGQVLKIKGMCTGMLMDVVLIDCVQEEIN